MTDRDLAIVEDIRSAIESKGLTARAVTGGETAAESAPTEELPTANILWRKTLERDLGGERLRLAMAEIEILLRSAVEGESDAPGELREIMSLKNRVVDCLMSDPGRSGLADGLSGTTVTQTVFSPTARNHYAECKVYVECDYVVMDDQER